MAGLTACTHAHTYLATNGTNWRTIEREAASMRHAVRSNHAQHFRQHGPKFRFRVHHTRRQLEQRVEVLAAHAPVQLQQ